MLKAAFASGQYSTSTWAGLPAAATSLGLIYRVTDFGVAGAGLLVISDGTRWVPLGPQILGRSGVAASVTGTTAETALGTVTVPAGLLGANGGLFVYTVWTYTNSANNKQLRVRFGGLAAGTKYLDFGVTTSAQAADMRRIRNRNSAAAQVGGFQAAALGGTGSGNGVAVTGALDTSVAQDLVISGQLALGTETVALENYEVWVAP